MVGVKMPPTLMLALLEFGGVFRLLFPNRGLPVGLVSGLLVLSAVIDSDCA